MNVLMVAGGQATRLAPLTDRIPKPLLPLAGKPILEHLYEQLLGVPGIACVHVLSNDRWFDTFGRWAASKPRALPIRVHNSAEGSAYDRSGALACVAWVIRHASLWDRPLLSLTGDTYIESSLADFVAATERAPDATWMGLHPTTDAGMMATYDSVEIAADGRVLAIHEPANGPGERLLRTGVSRLAAGHLRLLSAYLDDGQPVAKGGLFTRYLHARAPLYGFRMDGAWIDAGTPHELLAADNAVRARMGLPAREAYLVE